MHPEVDKEEGSTRRLYKSMPYKMYGIMRNKNYTKDFNQVSTKKTGAWSTSFQYQEQH